MIFLIYFNFDTTSPIRFTAGGGSARLLHLPTEPLKLTATVTLTTLLMRTELMVALYFPKESVYVLLFGYCLLTIS